VNERKPAPHDGTVKITDLAGSVRVSGWDRDSVAIRGALGEGVERLEFSTDERATRIRVLMKREYRGKLVTGSDLEIRVPRQSHVAVRTGTGAIGLSDVSGAVDLESADGTIRVEGAPRFVYARSVGGAVEVAGLSKVVRASSVSGRVTIRRAAGYVEASTVSGDVRLSGRGLWEGEVTTVSGDIGFDGSFDRGGSFSFETSSGAIEIGLPSWMGADIDIVTYSGSITNDLEPDAKPVRSANGPRRELVFSTAGGGTRLAIRTFKGAVHLLRSEGGRASGGDGGGGSGSP
jgi:hypothetical protein